MKLSNRSFHALLLALVITVGTSAHVANAADPAAPKQRLNILFLFADDWCRYAGAYSGMDGRPSPSDVVKTPNIDRLAREGVLFRNAFVTAPSCTPCRSSLLSGQYFFRTGRGAILRGAVWDQSIPSFPPLLNDAGYHIGETYKVWSPGTPNDAPFGLNKKHSYEKSGNAINRFSQNATKMVKEGMAFEEAKLKILEQVQGNFQAFLADRKPDQPWLYWFGPTNTHRIWEKGSGKALWGIEPDRLKGKLPKFMPDVPEVREDMADYLGEIQAWDASIGTLLKALEATGELDRTLIVVSGDHGAPGFPGGKCNLYDYGTGVGLIARVPGGKGGRVVDDMVNLMDLAPTFCEIGGVQPPAVMTGKSLVNVLKSEKSGQIDPERTWVVTGRERHVAEARADNLPYPQRALRTKEYLYIRNFEPARWPLGDPFAAAGDGNLPQKGLENNTYLAFPDMDASPTKAFLVLNRSNPQWKWFFDYAFAPRLGEELFDLKADPEQIKNVAADPNYAQIKSELSSRLLKTLQEANDPRVLDKKDIPYEKPPFTDPSPEGRPNARKRLPAE